MPSVCTIVIGSVQALIVVAYLDSDDQAKIGGEPKRFELNTYAEVEAKLDELQTHDIPVELFTRFSDGTEESGISVSRNLPTDKGAPAYQLTCEKCGKKYWEVGTPRPYMYGTNYHTSCDTCCGCD